MVFEDSPEMISSRNDGISVLRTELRVYTNLVYNFCFFKHR